MRRPLKILSCALLLATALSPVAARADFVDEYRSNVAANATPAANPVIRLLGGFEPLWLPGATPDAGVPTALGASVLERNIQYVVGVTQARDASQEARAYLDDRRNQSYGVIEGLGPLAPFYYAGSGAVTTIPDVIPPDATARSFNDLGTGAGLTTSELGSVVSLVATLRGPFSSTTPPKSFYLYPRPFRQTSAVVVAPALVPVISPTPSTDSGYPSGHTNAGYLAAFALAHATPERFQELLVRASELGDSRIVAGMHSPVDVIAGRVQATALAAAILSDPANAALKQTAHAQAHAYFLAQTGATSGVELAAFARSDRNALDQRPVYRARMSYGFEPIAAVDAPLRVPRAAEVLLETRLPYLDTDQRREVLRTTGLGSGLPLLDDPEGWGRLDLVRAADGYGAFDTEIRVFMDAARDGFHALDAWRNDISGPGGLIKQGSGALILTGHNTYAGGTRIEDGTLVAQSSTALGTGDVVVSAGTLHLQPPRAEPVVIDRFEQSAGGTLALSPFGSRRAVVEVVDKARLAGRLRVIYPVSVGSGRAEMELLRARHVVGCFHHLEVEGLPAGFKAKLRCTGRSVHLKLGRIDRPTPLAESPTTPAPGSHRGLPR